MSPWADMMPDRGWVKRRRVGRDGRVLSVTRAKLLHASTSLRSYLCWALVLTCYAIADDFESISAPIYWFLLAIAGMMLVATVWMEWSDNPRQADIQSKLTPDVAHSRHLFEVIAIPLLVFATFAALFVLSALGPLIQSASPDLMPWVQGALWALKYLPWMGLTALLMAIGAYQRWKEAVGQSASPNAPQIAT
jgi:hypothetical protein